MDRLKDFHQTIHDEERYKTCMNWRKTKKIDEFTLISFCHGLPLNYRLKIISNVCDDLLDTFVKARQSYMEEDLNRFDNMITSNHETGIKLDKIGTSDRNTWTISSNLLPKTCTYCKKLGHIKKECYKFKREQQIQSEESPPRLLALLNLPLFISRSSILITIPLL